MPKNHRAKTASGGLVRMVQNLSQGAPPADLSNDAGRAGVSFVKTLKVSVAGMYRAAQDRHVPFELIKTRSGLAPEAANRN
jgi:hypothetical protein